MIVRVFDRSGAYGYGECTAPEDPFFNHETIDTAWIVVTKHIAPLLTDSRIERADQTNAALQRIRGNRMAKGSVEAAIWDLEARIAGIPLWKHIGGTRAEISCGVSIGLQPSPQALVEKVKGEVESGYQRIKLKIKPGQDLALVEAVRSEFPKILLSVDANSAYSLAHKDLLRRLDEYSLLMIEPDRFRNSVQRGRQGCGAGACLNQASAERITSRCQPSRASPCPVMSRPPRDTGKRT
jgi:O-succinylbenzoate synthase